MMKNGVEQASRAKDRSALSPPARACGKIFPQTNRAARNDARKASVCVYVCTSAMIRVNAKMTRDRANYRRNYKLRRSRPRHVSISFALLALPVPSPSIRISPPFAPQNQAGSTINALIASFCSCILLRCLSTLTGTSKRSFVLDLAGQNMGGMSFSATTCRFSMKIKP